jgi:hypothetical protein
MEIVVHLDRHDGQYLGKDRCDVLALAIIAPKHLSEADQQHLRDDRGSMMPRFQLRCPHELRPRAAYRRDRMLPVRCIAATCPKGQSFNWVSVGKGIPHSELGCSRHTHVGHYLSNPNSEKEKGK